MVVEVLAAVMESAAMAVMMVVVALVAVTAVASPAVVKVATVATMVADCSVGAVTVAMTVGVGSAKAMVEVEKEGAAKEVEAVVEKEEGITEVAAMAVVG